MPYLSESELILPRCDDTGNPTGDNNWHTLPGINGPHSLRGMMGDDSQAQFFYWLGWHTKGRAVELGSWEGYSACLFALGMKHGPWGGKLFCVDNYAAGYMGQDALPAFWKNVDAMGVRDHIELKQMSCEDTSASSWLPKIEWCYQDASHVRREILINWDIYFPSIKKGGLWVIHDTHQEDPPVVMREKEQEGLISPVVTNRPDFQVWIKK